MGEGAEDKGVVVKTSGTSTLEGFAQNDITMPVFLWVLFICLFRFVNAKCI